MIQIHFSKTLREFELELALEIPTGETLVIVGPSGCGKTTALNCIAGLTAPDWGFIRLEEETVFHSGERINAPPEHRRVGYVFQDYALFPHLTVEENVAYGLRARRWSSERIQSRIEEVLALLQIEKLTGARPAQLSGGEQQRVALARAVAIGSQVLLLDEPLGALDATTRQHVRRELKRLLRRLQITAIVVTHDYADALALGQHILVMDQGQAVQWGTREELLLTPQSQFVADFTGVNYYEGQVVGNGAQPRKIRIGPAQLFATTEAQGEVSVSFFPSEVILSLEEPHTSARNVLYGPVREIVHLGDRLRVHVEGDLPVVAELTTEAFGALGLEEGKNVYAFFKATALRVSA